MRLGSVQVIEPAGHDQVLAAGEILIDRGGLAGQADHLAHGGGLAGHVVAGHPGLAGVGAHQGGQDPNGGGLAGAVGAEEPEHGAGWDGQVQVLQGVDLPEGLAQPFGLDRQLAHHHSSSSLAIASVATY